MYLALHPTWRKASAMGSDWLAADNKLDANAALFKASSNTKRLLGRVRGIMNSNIVYYY